MQWNTPQLLLKQVPMTVGSGAQTHSPETGYAIWGVPGCTNCAQVISDLQNTVESIDVVVGVVWGE